VDLTHTWSFHTPGWVGHPGGKLHSPRTPRPTRSCRSASECPSTQVPHLDDPTHETDTMIGMSDLPLTKPIHEGVIVDVSDECGDWDVITSEHIAAKVMVKPHDDIVILHAGRRRYYQAQPQRVVVRPDLVKQFEGHGGVPISE